MRERTRESLVGGRGISGTIRKGDTVRITGRTGKVFRNGCKLPGFKRGRERGRIRPARCPAEPDGGGHGSVSLPGRDEPGGAPGNHFRCRPAPTGNAPAVNRLISNRRKAQAPSW